MVDTSLGLIYALAWLSFGWTILLRGQLQLLTSNWSLNAYDNWLLPPLFAFIFGGIIAVLMLPLTYDSGFVLPHRYEMSNQSFKDWILDGLKGMAVGAPIGLIVLEVVYAFLRAFPQTWWLWMAEFLLFFNVLAANLAPILIMPIFNKFIPLGAK